MKIAGAAQKAAVRLRESATPLSEYIRTALGNVGVPPLDAGTGAPYAEVVKKTQRPGWRGFLDLLVFEHPSRRRKNKFTQLGSLNFNGAYPRELCSKRGLEVFYGKKE